MKRPQPDKIALPGIDYSRRHLSFGWYAFLFFSATGLGLESLHGFKVRAYLDLSNETRRLMWTLAHAHGTLLSLLNILFAISSRVFPEMRVRHQRAVSSCLILSTLLLPGGFFLGGFVFYGGDPGLGILLVPIGATILLLAIYLLLREERVAKTTESQGHR